MLLQAASATAISSRRRPVGRSLAGGSCYPAPSRVRALPGSAGRGGASHLAGVSLMARPSSFGRARRQPWSLQTANDPLRGRSGEISE